MSVIFTPFDVIILGLFIIHGAGYTKQKDCPEQIEVVVRQGC